MLRTACEVLLDLLYIFHMKACTAINKQADRNKSEQQSRGVGSPIPWLLPILCLRPVSAAVTWLPQDLDHHPHYTSVALLHIRGALSQVVLVYPYCCFNHLCFLQKTSQKRPDSFWKLEIVKFTVLCCLEESYKYRYTTQGELTLGCLCTREAGLFRLDGLGGNSRSQPKGKSLGPPICECLLWELSPNLHSSNHFRSYRE